MASPALSRGRGRPLTVVLPGITGSHLLAGNQHIWCNPPGLCASGIGALVCGRSVRPGDVIETYYRALITHLERTHEVMPLVYDRRPPIQTTGAATARLIQSRLVGNGHRPPHIVDHSMGGLVARMALIVGPALRSGFNSRPDSRFVMLRTPNGGSHAMVLALPGRATTVNALAAIRLSQDLADIAAIIHARPGPSSCCRGIC